MVPRVLWRFLQRTGHPLGSEHPEYPSFEAAYTEPRHDLTTYLERHSLVESVQTLDRLAYFVSKLVRGAFVFEHIAYLELRHSPYLRTDPALPEAARLDQMEQVVRTVARASLQPDYPVVVRQILCMHSRLSYEVNRATMDLAAALPREVCGVDLAGPDTLYASRMDELLRLFERARGLGLRTTGHVFETGDGCHPELLPCLDRIGHGIMIPLLRPDLLPEVSARGQCLEVCPTTYLQAGNLRDLDELRVVFARCADAGVDIAICTDNPGLHNVRLPFEYENLLTQDVIDFGQLRACQEAAFRHAFAWPQAEPPERLVTRSLLAAHTAGL